ncbi:hypothetical protein M430DRAFT_175593 [Amorphotheca resinae ATCC 22711]|uniref:Uncharacterized protein n=1 Tax=Amorphotheca resinae ATCC 22711 TaxID=857342 RepID=A0A2T3ASU9_AMORE|nr:hypothetical protein M430DRAFT_175593 [Amorphotheca resinae ATCC 22711]PSS10531.1 hypothetical protein M430DRAFT_175593 [Amorphotheca resinae ATCC 22711]
MLCEARSSNSLFSFLSLSSSFSLLSPLHARHLAGISFSDTHFGACATSQDLMTCPHSRYTMRRRQCGQSWYRESVSSH